MILSGLEVVGRIPIKSYKLGLGRGISLRKKQREISQCSISEISVSVAFSSKTNMLMGCAIAGAIFPTVRIVWETDAVILEVVLSDVILSGTSVCLGGKRSDINVSLNYRNIQQNVTSSTLAPIKTTPSLLDKCAPLNNSSGLSKDAWVRIASFLGQKDLLSLALSCKFLLHCSKDGLIESKTSHSWHYFQHNSRVGIDGFKVPKSLADSRKQRGQYGSDLEGEDSGQRTFPVEMLTT